MYSFSSKRICSSLHVCDTLLRLLPLLRRRLLPLLRCQLPLLPQLLHRLQLQRQVLDDRLAWPVQPMPLDLQAVLAAQHASAHVRPGKFTTC